MTNSDSEQDVVSYETDNPASADHSHRSLIGYAILAVLALIVYIILASLAKETAYFSFDLTITNAVQSIKSPMFGLLMEGLTWLGFSPQAYIISGVLIILFMVLRFHWESLVSLVSVLLGTRIGRWVKLFTARPRPSAELVFVLDQLKDFSFPSGHVVYFVTFYGFLLYLLLADFHRTWWKKILAIILGIMIAGVGISRIYVGAHWFSDVIGGYLLGTIILCLTIIIYRLIKARGIAR